MSVNITAPATSWQVSHGDQAWQLTAATFVALQSMPGLVMIYAGLSKSKWAINSAFMGIYGFAATLLVWVLYAYSMSFGDEWIPICGIPMPVLSMGRMLSQSKIPATQTQQSFNLTTTVYYQFCFAAITVIIIAGSLLGRMTFLSWAIFVPLYVSLTYTVGAFSIWGGGFLEDLGVLDYCGGYVIHVASGTAGFVAAALVGPRHPTDRADHRPSNLSFVIIGACILAIGWTGFNGGGAYTANANASVAVLNTYICWTVSVLSWMFCDVLYYGKPGILGAVQAMITGLVVVTPGAGFVPGWAAIVMGILAGGVPWVTLNLLGRFPPLCYVDDTLGGVHTHLLAGIIGGLSTGVFATREGVESFGLTRAAGGAIEGNWRQLWIQAVGFLFIIAWNAVWTSLILIFIRVVCRVPLRMTENTLLVGDEAAHGESAYHMDLPPLTQQNVYEVDHYAKSMVTTTASVSRPSFNQPDVTPV
ncbi:uncharacterized protein CcaverHIS019_0510290 [Cutaneotrichosporon cavernicola]|uniref:Ammonium transporter AmtB-like domain-containing protein n=1 Tax=Cutaneotrichosporon cavernicola TaxID=279322 RepID=A0AA48L7M6_9TREE|nr:uncharacterized protein CcaverHIS019_0510290 [Cutaneotrichosporon cavernicola]BEI93401.1 hypothetical protein CcaverHIS019_0510290 [Cutaneotrichosporon cavernicola]BEJ01179.1 hypothetical protein CcaverHIS631_0510360 [Cutaneotrichosporon cavernicola]